MVKSDELRTISETYGDAAEDAKTLEETIEEQRKKAGELQILSNKAWLKEQPISSHFDIEKVFAQKNKMSLSNARKTLENPLVKYRIQDKSIPDVIKDLRYHRRTLKGETKVKFTTSIDNLIDAYSDHLSKSIDKIYWISK